MKRKIAAIILVLAVVLSWRCVWIYTPCHAERVVYDQETGETIRENLTYEETIAMKKILWGRIRWPEWIYGYPACAFERNFSVVIDGKCYMPAWCCGMVAVEENGGCKFMNVTENQCEILKEIIKSRWE